MSLATPTEQDVAFDTALRRHAGTIGIQLAHALRAGVAACDAVVLVDGDQVTVLPRDLARVVFDRAGGPVVENLATEPEPGAVWVVAVFREWLTSSQRDLRDLADAAVLAMGEDAPS